MPSLLDLPVVRKAFITGITGQDGRHLAEFLHGKGYKVFGMMKGQHNPRAELLRDEFPTSRSSLATLRTSPAW